MKGDWLLCLDILVHGGQGTASPALLQLTAWLLVKDTHMVLGFFFFFWEAELHFPCAHLQSIA